MWRKLRPELKTKQTTTKTKQNKTKRFKEVEEYVKETIKKNSQSSKKEVESILWKLNKREEVDNNVNYGKEVKQVKLRKTSKRFGN